MPFFIIGNHKTFLDTIGETLFLVLSMDTPMNCEDKHYSLETEHYVGTLYRVYHVVYAYGLIILILIISKTINTSHNTHTVRHSVTPTPNIPNT